MFHFLQKIATTDSSFDANNSASNMSNSNAATSATNASSGEG
jgi:hypothetical protein